MDTPLLTLRKIFLDLNINFDKRFSNAFFAHSQMSKSVENIVDKNIVDENGVVEQSTKSSYFSIDRPSSFKHDHWKDDMPAQVYFKFEYISC